MVFDPIPPPWDLVIFVCVPLSKLMREVKQQKNNLVVGGWGGEAYGVILLPTFETLAICRNPPRLWVRYEGVWCRVCCPLLRLWRYVAILPGYGWDMKMHSAVLLPTFETQEICRNPPRLWVGYEDA
jgi:hypothetical protein